MQIFKRLIFPFLGISLLCISHTTVFAGDADIDSTFAVGTAANASVYPNEIQPDGKIIIGGGFTGFSGIAINRIARLNSDGSLDMNFVANLGSGANGFVYWIVLQPDGKILIGGDFTSINGVSRNRIARLNNNGTLDTSFTTPGAGANDRIRIAAVQTDGKIVIGGWFTTYDGLPRSGITRLNSDGTLDTSFVTGVGTAGPTGPQRLVQSLAIQTDGKIVIGGQFTSYNGVNRSRIARLNSNGSLDTTFGATANEWVYSIIILDNGKLLIAGRFSLYDGITRNRIARLNNDGTLDTSFDPGLGFNNQVRNIKLSADGTKIYAGGFFNTFNGILRNNIARINIDGTLDTEFDPGTGFNNTIWWLSVQSDGKIVPSGDFTDYNGTTINRITRLNSISTYNTTFLNHDTTFISSGRVNHGSLAIAPTNPIRTGYTFSGWTGGILTNITKDTIFTAVYNINQYTITFDSGSGTIVAPITNDYGTGITAPANPTRIGYTFSGWVPALPAMMPAINITVTGQWIPNQYLITFEDRNTTILSTGIVNHSSGAIAPTNPTRTGYTFSGWNSNFSNVTGSITITAQYIINQSVKPTVSAGGGGGGNFLTKDNCPNGDYTSSYYDGSCGKKQVQEQKTTPTSENIKNSIGAIDDKIFNPTITTTCFTLYKKPTIYQNNTVSKEFRIAHQMLYSYGLTMRKGTKDYRPYDGLTREAAAKFMVEFARNVLCREKTRTYNNRFSDLKGANPILSNFIQDAYEFEIFEGDQDINNDGITTFRPKDRISDDEIAIIMVKLVTHNKYQDQILGTDRASFYRTKLEHYTSVNLNKSDRGNIAEVIYDMYKNNIYTLDDIGYIIE